jgi:hypothetical protein
MKHGWNTDFSKPVRAGIFVATQRSHFPKLRRSDISGICRPAGAEIYFGLGFYKYAAPDGAGERGLQPASAHELTRALEILDAGRQAQVEAA